jgi:phage terminase small subunit
MSGRPLSPKERRFVSEFLKDQNAKQAAIRAGYSKKTAETQGPRLYRKVQVKAAIDTELAKIQEKAGVTQERILTALLNIAEFDPRKLFNKDGTLKKVHEIPDDVASAIVSLESDDVEGEMKKVRFSDKVRALELLGKHLKMFTDKTEVSDPNGAPVIINFSPATYDRTKNSQRSDDKGL